MAFWNTGRLRRECQAHGLVTPYRENRVVRCAYELGVGPEAFITSRSDETTHLVAKSKVTIPPGQFGLLITHEVVYVPDTAIALISIRARIKFQGLVNVSGFHVDPGFRGQLKFAVYNAGSKDIILDQDERVFMIWYADLDDATPDPYPPVPAAPSVITSDDVSRLKGEVASPAELKKQLEELKTALQAVEQVKLFNRSLLLMLLGAVVTLFFAFLKPYLDGSREAVRQPAAVAVQQVDNQQPILPAHLGLYVLGAGAITGACVIGGAFIIGRR